MDTIVGNDMIRGISGGQKKRVTTGEMIVGPCKTLFLDEVGLTRLPAAQAACGGARLCGFAATACCLVVNLAHAQAGKVSLRGRSHLIEIAHAVLTPHTPPCLQISTGLDSSSTFQIVKCMRDFVHHRQATLLMALLQPAPECYDLFDDILLLSEGELQMPKPPLQLAASLTALATLLRCISTPRQTSYKCASC